MADDPRVVPGDKRNLAIAILVKHFHQVSLGRCGECCKKHRADSVRILPTLRLDPNAHTVAMSGASSAFIPTTL